MISVDNLGVVEIGFELDFRDGNKQFFHQRHCCYDLKQRRFPNDEIIRTLRMVFNTAMNDLEYTVSCLPNKEYRIKIDNFHPGP